MDMKHTMELGKKHGIVRGVRKYLDDQGMTGAVGIIVALGAVLIGLYKNSGFYLRRFVNKTRNFGDIIAIVVGAMGTQVTSGNVLLSSRWNTTVSSIFSRKEPHKTVKTENGIDTAAGSTFNIATILPIAIVGIGIMTKTEKDMGFDSRKEPITLSNRGWRICRKVNSPSRAGISGMIPLTVPGVLTGKPPPAHTQT